jgi:precorrin-2/cobalt-factor-2 C20-methyltransferase
MNKTTASGIFYGIGVGPGPEGFLPVAGLTALEKADIIFTPVSRDSNQSVARQCLSGINIPRQKFREIEFTMATDRNQLRSHYTELAKTIAAELGKGLSVAYLTIGDTMTYSTYGYLLAALQDQLPQLEHCTFPGITSYSAAASALSWPLGEAKERILILPCPDSPETLQQDIENHDVVILMKIGARLEWVLSLLNEMEISQHCGFARRIGLSGELLTNDIINLQTNQASGYLATLLIRKTAREKRHS